MISPKSARDMEAPFLKQMDIYVSGREGYHTYRIPAVVVSTKGTILAFCEGRKESSSDFGDIDIVLRRSFDNGETWQPMQIIADNGRNTMGNPSPLVDQNTGTIWLLFCRNNYQVYVMKSSDDGATWSSPLEITKEVKRERWDAIGTGPCHGIQLKSGRLVIPCWHDWYFSFVIYSDDHGSCWKLGGTVDECGFDECTVVQTWDGSLYLNMRTSLPPLLWPGFAYVWNRIAPGWHGRAYTWSKDSGITWSDVQFDETLIEPSCQACVVRFTDKENHDKNRVLFSNPASQERVKMTMHLSYDECQTWPLSKLIYSGPSAYSDLAIASDMTIHCVYERGEKTPYEKITLANFNIEWLTDGADHLNLKHE